MTTTVDGMTIFGLNLTDANVFGTNSPAIGTTQLSFLAQSVVDTAVVVWMQMGLTNDQIKYGLAALNVESGFFPDITNGVSTDTIRGLGQVRNDVYGRTAGQIDSNFNLAPDDNSYITTTPLAVKNAAGFHVFSGNPYNTNVQSGESNDPSVGGAGIYDPQGLVKQLEVDGQLALQEWRTVGPSELMAALQLEQASPTFQSLCSIAVANGVPLPAVDQSPETIAALAYLNHHQGPNWFTTQGGIDLAIKGLTGKGGQNLIAAVGRVTGGFSQLTGYQQGLPNGTGTASDFIQGDPWALAGATSSFSDPDPGEIVISHDIPSMFPTLDNGLSQTLGGLSSFVVTQAGYVQSPTGLAPTHVETYTYKNNSTGAEDVVSGTATYNFTTLSGGGTEILGDQSTWAYNYTNLPSHFIVNATETSQSGAVISQMTETKTTLNGMEINSIVSSDGVATTGGQLDYITQSNQSEVAAFYDEQGLLIEVSVSSATGTSVTTVGPLTSDSDYASWAQETAQTFGVPVVDPDIQSAILTPPSSVSTVNEQESVTTSSTTSATSGTSSLDPGFQESAALADGATLSWSMNVDGTIKSRETYDQDGNFTSEFFSSSGELIGTSASTTSSDGQTVTKQLYNLQGATTGYSTATTYADGTSVAINGATTVYANGCVITTQYGVASDGSMGAATGFSISSTVSNADGSFTTTEQNYEANYSQDSFVSDTLLGSTVTVANGDTGTSTDYDASGAVTDSRVLTTDGNGNTTIENLNAAGAITASSTMSIDARGDVTLDSYGSDGALTDTRTLGASGVLTDIQYQGGTVAGVITYSETFDGGNLTTYANASGAITGDQWEHADGSYGADTISVGGTIVGTAHYTDGSSSSSVDSGQGDITTTTVNAAGATTGTTATTIAAGSITSQFISTANTVNSEATLSASGAIQATTLESSGNSVGIADDASDDISWVTNSATGGNTSQFVDSNGNFLGTAVTTVATNGAVTVTNFNATGAETGYSITSTVDGVVTTTNYADSASTFSESSYSQTVANATGSTTTDYTLEAGVAVETGYAVGVTAANGDTTTTNYTLNSDGSATFVVSGSTEVSVDSQGNVTKQEFDSTGALSGYTEERIDSSGDTLITSYDNAGDLLSTSTVYASGIVNNVLYESDNGNVSTTWQTSGTYQQTTDDDEGDVTTTNYAANGTALGDTWTQSGGSLGQDTFNVDGSEHSVSNDGLGDLTTTTIAASGAVNSIVDYYDNGSATTTVDSHDSSWALRGSVQVSTTSDGTETDTSYYDASNNLVTSNSVTTSTDGLTVTGSHYDAEGLLGSRSVVTSADGLTVTTTAMDGGGGTLGTRVVTTSADGSSTSTSSYDATGDLLGVTTNVVSTDGLTTTTSNYGTSNNLLNYSTAVTSSNGLTVTTSNYNAANQLLGDSIVVTSSDGSTVTTSNYDGSNTLLGYQTVVISADGQTTTTSDYSASGQLLDSKIAAPSSDGLGVTTTYLNAQGEALSSDTAYTSSDGTSVLTKSFDAEGNETSYSIADTGEDGSVTTVKYSLSATGVATYAGTTVVFDPGTSVVPAWGNGEIYTAGSVGTLIDAVGTNDLVYGESGNDTLVALGAGTTLYGGTASDLFEVNDPTDVVLASGTGNDTLLSSVSYTLPNEVDTLTLTGSANLTAQGNTDASNLITGNAGNDTLIGGSGSDTLVAGSGIDALEAGTGSDDLQAGSGFDTLVAGSGADTLQGQLGDTYVLNAGFGKDEIQQVSGSSTLEFGSGITAADLEVGITTGSDGNPALLIQDGNSQVTIDGGLGGTINEFDFADGSQLDLAQLVSQAPAVSTTVAGASGNLIFNNESATSIDGGVGDDTIYGFGANDTLIAGSGNQQLFGENSGDLLVGSIGDDSLYGGSGDDTLVAGSGNTEMYGGSGTNSYVLTEGGTSTINASASPGTEILYLPQGLTLADFTSFEDPNGDLVIQSLSGDTTAIVPGFYNASSDNKTWLIAGDSDPPQFLEQWAGSQHQPSSNYGQEIDALKQSYEAELGVTLNDIGEKGGSIENPSATTPPNNPPFTYIYQFNGVSQRSVTVTGGSLDVGPTESQQTQSTVLQQPTTQTTLIPIYQITDTQSTLTFIPVGDTPQDQLNLENNDVQTTVIDGVQGELVSLPSETQAVITGYTAVTEVLNPGVIQVNEQEGFSVTNVTGDGGNDVITATAPYVGAISTGDGNVSVNLGGSPSIAYYNSGSVPLGAFVEAGAGNDTIVGGGGADTIAAGSGFDYLSGALGATYYVPLEGDATDVIADAVTPYGGGNAFPLTTLVLPAGVTPQDLQYRVFDGPTTGSQVLQLRYGDSTVLVDYSNTGVIEQLPGGNNASAGVNLFQFADGTVLTRDQLIAQATLLPNDFNPVVSANNQFLSPGQSVSAATFFSATDNSDNPITWYQVTNTGTGGGHFTLNGQIQSPGQTFYVSTNQLSELSYVGGGASGVADSVQVSAFDGAIWSPTTTFDVATYSSTNSIEATGVDQLLLGNPNSPAVLTGGFAGDTLVGGSGQDTFIYAAGGGPEVISETMAPSSTSDNILQFGSGTAPGSITLTEAAGGVLVLATGNNDDSVSIEGFDPLNPLGSMSIQQFQFSGGTDLSFLQLLAQANGNASSFGNADGSTTSYSFSPGASTVYSATTSNAAGQTTEIYNLNSDGSTDRTTFSYGTDGSSTQTEVQTAAGATTSTTTIESFDAHGNLLTDDITNPDGSTDDTTFSYNADGSSTQTEVQTAAGASTSTTTVESFSASGHLLTYDVTNPDGSTDDTTDVYNADGSYTSTEVQTAAGASTSTTMVDSYNASGRPLFENTTNPDGSTNDLTFSYNSDGSYSCTEVQTAAGASASTTTVESFDTTRELVTSNTTNPDGSTDDLTFSYNSDGSYSYTAVQTAAGASASTTTIASFGAAGELLTSNTTNPDGSTDDSTYSYNADGSFTQTDVRTAAGASASTTIVESFDAAGNLMTVNITNPDGSTDESTYSYNPDGSYSYTEVQTATGASASTTTVESFNAAGNPLIVNITNPDGSTDNSTFSYNADGSYTKTEVQTAAGASVSATTVESFDAAGNLILENAFNTAGQLITQFTANADGSTDNSTYSYNSDGSYTDTVVATASDGSQTVTAYGYNAQGQLLSTDVSNPDGSTDYYAYDTQGQILAADISNVDGSTNDSSYTYNADGSYSDTVVTTPAGSTAATTTTYGYNSQGQLQSADTQNPDGSTDDYGYNNQGQILTADITNADGSTDDSTYTYNADGSYSDKVVTMPAGSTAATTTTYSYNSQGQLQSTDTLNPGGSTTAYSYNAAGEILSADITHADGSTNDSTYGYNADGSYTDTVVITSAAGSASTTVYSYDTQGQLQSADTTNPDGSTDNYGYNTQGQIVTADITNTDGSTNDSTYAYNADGSYTDTVVTTASGGSATSTVYGYNAQGQLQSADTTNPDGSADDYGYNAQGQILTADITNADGSTNDSTYTYTYNSDGSYSDTVVTTLASGGATTTAYSYDAQGQLQSADTTNPDGSSDDYAYNGAGQILSANITNADGSTNDSTYAFNADGSYSDTVVAMPAGGGATTTVYSYASSGQLQSADITNPDGSVDDYSYNSEGQIANTNDFVPSANGSYTDTWSTSNGATGEYWWNSATYEYQETWQNADGSSFTDTYQYAAGGSPGASGYSFAETYGDSSGDTGSRTYDAATGVTTVSWDSVQTGAISGTSANDSGFIGLQLEGEVTNTSNDPTYFNPLLSSAFNVFLTAHG